MLAILAEPKPAISCIWWVSDAHNFRGLLRTHASWEPVAPRVPRAPKCALKFELLANCVGFSHSVQTSPEYRSVTSPELVSATPSFLSEPVAPANAPVPPSIL